VEIQNKEKYKHDLQGWRFKSRKNILAKNYKGAKMEIENNLQSKRQRQDKKETTANTL